MRSHPSSTTPGLPTPRNQSMYWTDPRGEILSGDSRENLNGGADGSFYGGKMPRARVTAARRSVLVRPRLPQRNRSVEGSDSQPERTIYVPFDDLPVILGGPNQRVFLTREEFKALQKLASRKPSESRTDRRLLLESVYEIDVRDQLAMIQGTLEIEVLNPGLQTVALPMSGVQLRSAQLDGQPAPGRSRRNG